MTADSPSSESQSPSSLPTQPQIPAWAAPGANSANLHPGPTPNGQWPNTDSGTTQTSAAHPNRGPQTSVSTNSLRAWQPGVVPLRPFSFGDFLTVPFKVAAFNRGAIVGGPLLIAIVSAGLTVVGGWMFIQESLGGVVFEQFYFDRISTATWVVLGLATFTWILADLLATTLIAPAVAAATLGRKISLSQAFAAVWHRIGQILLLYVITSAATLIVLGIGVIAVLPAVRADADGPMAFLAIMLAALLATPVLILISLFGMLARPVLMLESVSAVGALRRIFFLIKGRFWWTVLILLVTGIIVSIITGILQQGGQILLMIIIAVASSFASSELLIAISFAVFFGISTALSSLVTYAYFGSLYNLLYVDYRIRKEGLDVDLTQHAEQGTSPW